ncbi:hypothetical protein [Pseudarthrobacter sp. CC4]|uniref:hypothetical protein n=1 Tax=Pseudarthrobacter sp. CC4 TaxID=3029190 RepID=UPI003BA03A48
MQRAGAPGAAVSEPVGVPDDDGGADVVGAADVASGLAELPAGGVVCACDWPGLQALSINAADAAAVEMTNPWKIR